MEEKDLLLSPQMLQQIGKQLGYSNAIPPQFVELASTLLMGGMSKKANTEQGAEELLQSLDTNGDGYLDEIERKGADLSNEDKKKGILDNLLGSKLDPLAEAFAQATGLPKNKAKQLMMMLAPVLLAMVAQKVTGAQNKRQEVAKEVKNTYKVPPRSKEEFRIEQQILQVKQQMHQLEMQKDRLKDRMKELEDRQKEARKHLKQKAKASVRRPRYQTPNKEDGGLLEQILDRDGDGNFVDDAAQILKGLLLK